MAEPVDNTNLPEDSGTDAPDRSLEQTQGTPPLDISAYFPGGTAGGAFTANEDAGVGATSFSLPGQGASNDDNSNGTNTAAGTAQIINSAFNEQITPQPNVLDQYASYTYNLAWYIITPEQFNNLSLGPPAIESWCLVAKSGGAAAQTDANGNGKRSPFFPIDYYMDNLTIDSPLVGGGGSGMATTGAPEFNFSVFEPNGLTLPAALAGAVNDYYKRAGVDIKAPDSQTYFCMVIKFYGYDTQGNLVDAGRNGNQSGFSSAASPRAVVQKVYPFNIKHFGFKLTTGGVEYKIEATSPPFSYNLGTQRGMIPTPIECVGATVKDILFGVGDSKSVVAKPEGRDAQETPTVPTAPQPAAEPDDAQTAALFNDGTGYQPGYDPTAGWSA